MGGWLDLELGKVWVWEGSAFGSMVWFMAWGLDLGSLGKVCAAFCLVLFHFLEPLVSPLVHSFLALFLPFG
jgi:hypothetical protein